MKQLLVHALTGHLDPEKVPSRIWIDGYDCIRFRADEACGERDEGAVHTGRHQAPLPRSWSELEGNVPARAHPGWAYPAEGLLKGMMPNGQTDPAPVVSHSVR